MAARRLRGGGGADAAEYGRIGVMRRRAEVRLLKAMHARAESEMLLQALHGERWCGCKLTNEGDAAASFRLRGGCTRRVCDGERACVMAGASAKHSGSVESGGLPICGDVVAVNGGVVAKTRCCRNERKRGGESAAARSCGTLEGRAASADAVTTKIMREEGWREVLSNLQVSAWRKHFNNEKGLADAPSAGPRKKAKDRKATRHKGAGRGG